MGSATTLVASKFLESAQVKITPGIALFLLGPILLDTVNLKPEEGRVTEKDAEVAKRLFDLAPSISQQEAFKHLEAEKFNVASLSSRDLLRKDYKEYGTTNFKYGIEVIVFPGNVAGIAGGADNVSSIG